MSVMPQRIQVVSEVELPDHPHLRETDTCMFWGEYTAYEHTGGKNWNFSATNQLISNFKKDLSRQGMNDWHYKGLAVRQVAAAFSQMVNWQMVRDTNRAAIIPIPPSKQRSDRLYDDRLMQVLKIINENIGGGLDIRDCLSFDGSLTASHVSGYRPTPQELIDAMELDIAAAMPARQPGLVIIFDDMLTTGAHFVAVREKLQEIFPDVELVGMFIARRQTPSPFG